MGKNEMEKIVIKLNEEESKEIYRIACTKDYDKQNKNSYIRKLIIFSVLSVVVFVGGGFLLGFLQKVDPNICYMMRLLLILLIIFCISRVIFCISILISTKSNEKKQKEREFSTTYTFFEENIVYFNCLREEIIKYDDIKRAGVLQNGLIFYTSSRIYHYIPWRFTEKTQYDKLEALFREKLSDRFAIEEEPIIPEKADIVEENPMIVPNGELIGKIDYISSRKTFVKYSNFKNKRILSGSFFLLFYSVIYLILSLFILESPASSTFAVILIIICITSVFGKTVLTNNNAKLYEKRCGNNQKLKLYKNGVFVDSDNDIKNIIPFDTNFSWSENKKFFEINYKGFITIIPKSKETKQIIELIKQAVKTARTQGVAEKSNM